MNMTCSFVFLLYFFLLVGLKVFAVLEAKPEPCGAQQALLPWLLHPQPCSRGLHLGVKAFLLFE